MGGLSLSATSQELLIQQLGGGILTVNSPIQNNGTIVTSVYAGGTGTTILGGSNTFTGGLYINGGTVELGSAGDGGRRPGDDRRAGGHRGVGL